MSASISVMFIKNACKLCRFRSQIQRQMIIYRTDSTFSHHSSIEADLNVMQQMKDNGITYKKHPGILRLKNVKIPEELEKSIDAIIEKYPLTNLLEHAQTLMKYLQGRRVPVERHAFEIKLSAIEQEMTKKENIDVESLNEVERKKYENKMRRKITKRLRQVIYHWQPMIYNAPKAIHYLVARTTADYSSIINCLTEIKIRDPDFTPKTVFDFGSGVGSTIWATNELWSKSVFEYYCVDKSSDMNTVARLLLQDGQEQKQMRIPGVYFRNFAPSMHQNKFNMVVCSYTLLELSSLAERQQLVESLWNMTENYLVLIEKGGNAGFSLIHEARQLLLKLSADKHNSTEGHIFAPCTHDKACPKLEERNSPCFFESKYVPLKQVDRSKGVRKEWFSYIIFKTGPKPQEVLPRIIQEVKKPSRHSHCHLCCSDGKLRHVIISDAKHGKDFYKCSRYSSWGDQLPGKIVQKPMEQTLILDNNTNTNLSEPINEPVLSSSYQNKDNKCALSNSDQIQHKNGEVSSQSLDTESKCDSSNQTGYNLTSS